MAKKYVKFSLGENELSVQKSVRDLVSDEYRFLVFDGVGDPADVLGALPKPSDAAVPKRRLSE